MRRLAYISLLLMNGCLGHSLGEVRATAPLQTRTFAAPYEELAACTKYRIETDSWLIGQPSVHSTRDPNTPLVSVSAVYIGSTLFEVTFQPASSAMALVKYRRGYDGYDSQEKTWAIIESCSRPEIAPRNPDAAMQSQSSLPQP